MTSHELARKLLELPDIEVRVDDSEHEVLRPIFSARAGWADEDGELPWPDWFDDAGPPPVAPRDRFTVPSVVIRYS